MTTWTDLEKIGRVSDYDLVLLESGYNLLLEDGCNIRMQDSTRSIVSTLWVDADHFIITQSGQKLLTEANQELIL